MLELDMELEPSTVVAKLAKGAEPLAIKLAGRDATSAVGKYEVGEDETSSTLLDRRNDMDLRSDCHFGRSLSTVDWMRPRPAVSTSVLIGKCDTLRE